ncbi:hypothetical protein ACFRCI_00880 [Streptomyces sp. NPDC056638]|uniref:hypothetical protein n=1 Tax=Streptomyces sp. NPDC056638 TaxID=3345887 RepID=UPI00368509F9
MGGTEVSHDQGRRHFERCEAFSADAERVDRLVVGDLRLRVGGERRSHPLVGEHRIDRACGHADDVAHADPHGLDRVARVERGTGTNSRLSGDQQRIARLNGTSTALPARQQDCPTRLP